MCQNWKAFGPTSEYSEGDADFYRLTDRLSAQYGMFQPEEDVGRQNDAVEGPSESDTPGLMQDPRQRPEFGLSQKQIAALGLSGPQMRLPDPVSSALLSGLANIGRAARQASSHHHMQTSLTTMPCCARQVTLGSRNYLRGEKFKLEQFGYNTANMAGILGGASRPSSE